MDTQQTEHYEDILTAARERREGFVGPFLEGYVTPGGTWILSSVADINDDDKPHDLIAVVPMAAPYNEHVIPLRSTANPDLVMYLRSYFQIFPRQHEHEVHQIDEHAIAGYYCKACGAGVTTTEYAALTNGKRD